MEIENIALTNLIINIPILLAVIGIWVSASKVSFSKPLLLCGLAGIALSSLIPLPLTNWLMSYHADIINDGQAPLIIISLSVSLLEAAGLILLVYSFVRRVHY